MKTCIIGCDGKALFLSSLMTVPKGNEDSKTRWTTITVLVMSSLMTVLKGNEDS